MITNAVAIVNIFSGPMPNTAQHWLATNFPEGRAFLSSKDVPLAAARNTMVRDAIGLLKDEAVEWAWFLDNDVTLTYPGIERFQEVPGDVVSCDCAMPTGAGAWEAEDAFHDHFWRCSRKVLLTIPLPWFRDNLSDDGCDLIGCDCSTFRQKALDFGFRVRHGGWCGHGCKQSWKGYHA